jgi:hypothetical protein
VEDSLSSQSKYWIALEQHVQVIVSKMAALHAHSYYSNSSFYFLSSCFIKIKMW